MTPLHQAFAYAAGRPVDLELRSSTSSCGLACTWGAECLKAILLLHGAAADERAPGSERDPAWAIQDLQKMFSDFTC